MSRARRLREAGQRVEGGSRGRVAPKIAHDVAPGVEGLPFWQPKLAPDLSGRAPQWVARQAGCHVPPTDVARKSVEPVPLGVLWSFSLTFAAIVKKTLLQPLHDLSPETPRLPLYWYRCVRTTVIL